MPDEKPPIHSAEAEKPELMPAGSHEAREDKGEIAEAPLERAAESTVEKYAQILSTATAPSTQASDDVVRTDAQSLAPLEDAASTVSKLVTLAETKGVAHAVAVAQKLNELYTLDTLHDRLADDLSEALAQKGLIQSE